MPHAWATDSKGGVIELAWDEPAYELFAVAIPEAVDSRAQTRPGLFGPLLHVDVFERG